MNQLEPKRGRPRKDKKLVPYEEYVTDPMLLRYRLRSAHINLAIIVLAKIKACDPKPKALRVLMDTAVEFDIDLNILARALDAVDYGIYKVPAATKESWRTLRQILIDEDDDKLLDTL